MPASTFASTDDPSDDALAGRASPGHILDISRRNLRDDARATERALVVMALRRVTTAMQRRRLIGSGTLAVVIRVPSAAWVAPVTRVVRAAATWHHVYEAASAPRARGEDPDRDVSATLAAGGRVLGVSPNLAWLPPSLAAAADLSVALHPSDASIVTAVIMTVTGGTFPRPTQAPVVGDLDFPDIVAAIRRGSTPAECHARLTAARAVRSAGDPDVPDAPALADLHGYGAAMTWARDLVDDLAEWRAERSPFPTATSRVVLAGPPGTGKTTLIRSLAREADLHLVATSVAAWFSDGPGYLDSVIKAISAVFERARSRRPAIVLLDEIDALPNRATMSDRDRVWWTTIVTHVLLCLDSATSGVTAGVVIVGATNHGDYLDEALTRPGRLERIIHLTPPDDPAVREAIIRTHLRGDLAADDLTAVGQVTAGATGATLMALVRDARRRARVERRGLKVADLMALAAPPSNRPYLDDRRYAVHESGHAIAAVAVGYEISMVSLLETATSHASVQVAQAVPYGVVTREDCELRVTVLLSGMAAEEVIYGTRSMGSGGSTDSDLARATAILVDLHAVHGMGDRLAYAPPYAGYPDPRLMAEVERDMQRLYVAAKRIVSERLGVLETLVSRLLEARVVTGAEVHAMYRAERPTTGTPAEERQSRSAWSGPVAT